MAETDAVTALSVDGLSVRSPRPPLRPLVDDVSLAVRRGECLGLVGESGSGKSLLLRSIIGLVPAPLIVTGRLRLAGTSQGLESYDPVRVRGTRVGMVFQDPMRALNPLFTVARTLREPLRQHHHLDRRSADARALDLLSEVGIPDPKRIAASYPHELSGGLRQRVMIAAALSGEPEILLCDEPTTALDVTTQSKILDLLEGLQHGRGLSLVFVTHDLAVVNHIADRIVVLYAGQLVESGETSTVLSRPSHPYTQGLLASIPSRVGRQERFRAIPGQPIGAAEQVVGCRFQVRCALAGDDGRVGPIPLFDLERGHTCRCVRAAQRPVESAPRQGSRS